MTKSLLVVCAALLLFTVSAQASANDLSDAEIERLVEKAVGESSDHPENVACVMRNRIDGGWSPRLVHRAFNAARVSATDEQRAKVLAVLLGDGECDPAAWYQWANSDVTWIRPRADCFLFSDGSNQYFSRCALWR